MKKQILSACAILLFVLTPLLFAQDEGTSTGNEALISAVKIEGNKRIATETYLYYITVKTGTPLNEETLRQDFQRLWNTGFLNDLQVEYDETPAGIEVTFRVDERPLLRAIEYEGNKKISAEDIETKLKDENIVLRTDQPFDTQLGQQSVNAIEKLMQEKGLQFGKAAFKTEDLGNSYTKLTFVIDEGPKARIGEILFERNTVFSDGKLKRTMKDTREHWLFSFITRKDDFEKEKFEKDIEKVQQLYYDKGYINARIEEPKIELLEEEKRIKITIPILEGEQFRTGKISFAGATVFKSETLLPLIELKAESIFNRSKLKKGLEEIQNAYGNRGYVYAVVTPVFEIHDDKRIVDVQVEVQENGQFYVRNIEYTGNNFTRDKVIRREMLVHEGDLLRVNRFRESMDRIFRLGYFDDLKPNIVPSSDGKNTADITIDVKENKRNEIRVGGGFSELEGFFGNLVFSTKNLFGTGKTFTVSLQGGSRSENYGFDILDPYFLDRRLSLGFSVYKTRLDYFGQFFRDTVGGSMSLGFPLMEEFKGIVTYGYQVVDVSKIPNATIPDEDEFPGFEFLLDDRTESRLSPQLVRSTVNNPMDPSRGTRFILTNEYVGGFLGGDLNYYKPQANFTAYVPGFHKKHYAAFNVEGGYGTGLSDQELPFFERYFLGGDRSIRGYEIRTVGPVAKPSDPKGFPFPAGGNKFLVLNAEYVINIAGPLKVAGFVDYGNSYAKGEGIDFGDMRGSTGLEVRFLAPVLSAPFRFIYAYNFNRGPLLTLSPSRRPETTVFRFSVGTTF